MVLVEKFSDYGVRIGDAVKYQLSPTHRVQGVIKELYEGAIVVKQISINYDYDKSLELHIFQKNSLITSNLRFLMITVVVIIQLLGYQVVMNLGKECGFNLIKTIDIPSELEYNKNINNWKRRKYELFT